MNFLSKKPSSGKKTKKLTILQHKIHNEMKTLLYPNKEKKITNQHKRTKRLKKAQKKGNPNVQTCQNILHLNNNQENAN